MSLFIKNIFKISTGSIIAQGVGIITMPIFTRYFTARAFGVLGLFLSTATILSEIISLRYELAILLPKKESKAKSVFVTNTIFFLVITLDLLAYPCMVEQD